eukprot:TRINITY_DN3153_c0_g1_i1.p1 TRINITY_DN3153_c0_g1~~TRINITY_DN3153_c0_g1_i1.p1  ORF type:complete len:1316 (-),score=324.54 TRINITY_DN3153_c0_g1_i1:347-4294(-)
MPIRRFYRLTSIAAHQQSRLSSVLPSPTPSIRLEWCFYVEYESDASENLTADEYDALRWLLAETFLPHEFGTASFFADGQGTLIEVGPRMNFTTAWSTNAVSICHSCGLNRITRIERSRRYLIDDTAAPMNEHHRKALLSIIHDQMTECEYRQPLVTFETGIKPEAVFSIPVMEKGKAALQEINVSMGLAFDEWDIDYYTDLFVNKYKRNPTNVECFDIAQSNSEHSRHWFFRGRIVVDGEEIPKSLMKIVKSTLDATPDSNSVIAFKDNSSAIRGFPIKTILPETPGQPGQMSVKDANYDLIFTAETHNFPSGVAPFPGAETGTGGRIRDGSATGIGSLPVAGTAAYCVGNLHIPGYKLPWEDESFVYPENLAAPLRIEIEASNGASDYGNKYGEPVIQGFTRSFGLRLPNGERREYVKPIMFSGGVGQMDSRHTEKLPPAKDMIVVKLGGPAYRIGIGGGAASSMLSGANDASLDFNAVQRGDAEMEQKFNRVIRACVELGENNPIISIHDQGAGGNCNVLKEIVDPAGAVIDIRKIAVGDKTLSVMELWGAEYQENSALLIKPEHAQLFADICKRERAQYSYVGHVTDDGRIVVRDSTDGSTPVDMDLSSVLGDMPQKTFTFDRIPAKLEPLSIPENTTVSDALNMVFRLVSVGSKRFLTNKVDRSVTGLIARQQCVGPLQLPLSDVAVMAQSHFGITGAAISIGEQPIKGLVNAPAMGRLCVGEAVTNLMWAAVTSLRDTKCSGNWMWAAKLPGEGALLYDACKAMSDAMIALGIAIDGGKDSLSMAARTKDEVIKAPGTLVVSCYNSCYDITKTVTPDIKHSGSTLFYVDLSKNNMRLGGSSLAHVFKQIGNDCPDLEDTTLLLNAFNAVQDLIRAGAIKAGHDRSDGGLITTILEMAFPALMGLDVDIAVSADAAVDPLRVLFNEELGFVVEAAIGREQEVVDAFTKLNVPVQKIGTSTSNGELNIRINGQLVFTSGVRDALLLWEETSYQLDRLQANPKFVDQDRDGLKKRTGPKYNVDFTLPNVSLSAVMSLPNKPRIAVIREEGSNGDREMTSAFYVAGFDTWDVSMNDLLSGSINLDGFRGVTFVGGFSYADVLDSAKGWAAAILKSPKLAAMFAHFYQRKDVFSLGVCNGCQLMALLGWVPGDVEQGPRQPRFVHNRSERYESRFVTVQVQSSPAIMLQGMQGSSLGVWISHGEGQALFPDSTIYDRVLAENLAPVRYVDDDNKITEEYPLNPNGSPAGIAGLCSADGRHLAMMPHPERTLTKWQWGYIPEEFKNESWGSDASLNLSPWVRMFTNAYDWCTKTA